MCLVLNRLCKVGIATELVRLGNYVNANFILRNYHMLVSCLWMLWSIVYRSLGPRAMV